MGYSQLEKKIISDISTMGYDNSNVLELIKRHTLTNKGLMLNFKERKIKLLVPINEINWIGSFFEIIVFLEDLESNGWIYIHSNSLILSEKKHMVDDVCISNNIDQNFIDAHQAEYGVQDVPTNFYEKIERYMCSFIIPTNKLRELVNHKFKTTEQINFEKEIKFTRVSLAIAIFALVFSLLSPFLFETTIDKEQFKILVHYIQQASSQ